MVPTTCIKNYNENIIGNVKHIWYITEQLIYIPLKHFIWQ